MRGLKIRRNERSGSPVAGRGRRRPGGADESLNRYCAVAKADKKSAWRLDGKQIKWSAVDARNPKIVAHFPIYDWTVPDIWKYHGETGLRHNEVYDLMNLCGLPLTEQRICQPYGDDQRKGLDLWAQIEPETWHLVLDRVVGVNYGARYAGEKLMGYQRGVGLPEGHTWKSYTFLFPSLGPVQNPCQWALLRCGRTVRPSSRSRRSASSAPSRSRSLT